MFTRKNLQKGFTLIELLVVVAIIGILSSIVLVSLNSARQKGRDASAKGSMSSIRAQAEIVFDNDGVYTNLPSDAGFDQLIQAALTQTGNNPAWSVNANTYAVSVLLNNGTYFCVDSDGHAGAASVGVTAGNTQCTP